MDSQQSIVPGITLSPSGQASIDPSLHDVLFDLAIALEEPTGLAVDVEHVVAAILLAASGNDRDWTLPMVGVDPELIAILTPHVKLIFERYGGKLGSDD